MWVWLWGQGGAGKSHWCYRAGDLLVGRSVNDVIRCPIKIWPRKFLSIVIRENNWGSKNFWLHSMRSFEATQSNLPVLWDAFYKTWLEAWRISVPLNLYPAQKVERHLCLNVIGDRILTTSWDRSSFWMALIVWKVSLTFGWKWCLCCFSVSVWVLLWGLNGKI